MSRPKPEDVAAQLRSIGDGAWFVTHGPDTYAVRAACRTAARLLRAEARRIETAEKARRER